MAEDRITELEIALTHAQSYVEELNRELIRAHRSIELLQARVTRLERVVANLLPEGDGLPADDPPPHY